MDFFLWFYQEWNNIIPEEGDALTLNFVLCPSEWNLKNNDEFSMCHFVYIKEIIYDDWSYQAAVLYFNTNVMDGWTYILKNRQTYIDI